MSPAVAPATTTWNFVPWMELAAVLYFLFPMQINTSSLRCSPLPDMHLVIPETKRDLRLSLCRAPRTFIDDDEGEGDGAAMVSEFRAGFRSLLNFPFDLGWI